MSTLSAILQAAHLLCATLWIGSLIYTEWVLWPQMRELGYGSLRPRIRSMKMRRKMGIAIVGTLLTGYLRGWVDGVFDRIFSTYGALFLLSAIIVTASVVWWLHFPTRDRKVGWFLYYASFALVFPLMIALRVLAAP